MEINIDVKATKLEWPAVQGADNYDCEFKEIGNGGKIGPHGSPKNWFDVEPLLKAGTLSEGRMYRFVVKALSKAGILGKGSVLLRIEKGAIQEDSQPPTPKDQAEDLSKKIDRLQALISGISSSALKPEDADKKTAEIKQDLAGVKAEVIEVQNLFEPLGSAIGQALQTKAEQILDKIDRLEKKSVPSTTPSSPVPAPRDNSNGNHEWPWWVIMIMVGLVIAGLVALCGVILSLYFHASAGQEIRAKQDMSVEATNQRNRADRLQDQNNELRQENLSRNHVMAPPLNAPAALQYYVVTNMTNPVPAPPPPSIEARPHQDGSTTITNTNDKKVSHWGGGRQETTVKVVVNNVVCDRPLPQTSQDIYMSRVPSISRMSRNMRYQYPGPSVVVEYDDE